MSFADVIKKQRAKSGLTQAGLARCLNVSTSTIGMWESGRRLPSFEKLEEIADFFNINMGDLRGSEEDVSIQTIAAHSATERTDEEAILLKNYHFLNKEGQQKLIDYAKDLVASGRYAEKNNQPSELSKDA